MDGINDADGSRLIALFIVIKQGIKQSKAAEAEASVCNCLKENLLLLSVCIRSKSKGLRKSEAVGMLSRRQAYALSQTSSEGRAIEDHSNLGTTFDSNVVVITTRETLATPKREMPIRMSRKIQIL